MTGERKCPQCGDVHKAPDKASLDWAAGRLASLAFLVSEKLVREKVRLMDGDRASTGEGAEEQLAFMVKLCADFIADNLAVFYQAEFATANREPDGVANNEFYFAECKAQFDARATALVQEKISVERRDGAGPVPIEAQEASMRQTAALLSLAALHFYPHMIDVRKQLHERLNKGKAE